MVRSERTVIEEIKMIWSFIKENAYAVMAGTYVVVAVAAFATGHPFVGLMAAAGAGLSGSALLKDNLPKDPDDMNSAQ
jgi:expansin (peptidoglycan-binding protein)